jgi:hypothetical protein
MTGLSMHGPKLTPCPRGPIFWSECRRNIVPTVDAISFFFHWPGYFSPRKGCPRVLKFCMGSYFTKILGLHTQINSETPLPPVLCYIMGLWDVSTATLVGSDKVIGCTTPPTLCFRAVPGMQPYVDLEEMEFQPTGETFKPLPSNLTKEFLLVPMGVLPSMSAYTRNSAQPQSTPGKNCLRTCLQKSP